MTFALDRPQFQRQTSAQGMGTRNHLRTRQSCRLRQLVGMKANQFGKEQKQPAATGKKPSRRQREAVNIGHRFNGSLRLLGPLLIQAARQGRKSLGLEELSDGRWAQGEFAFLESLADFIDRMILFAQSDDQGTGGRLFGLGAGPPVRGDEESGTGIADKGMTQDAEGARSVTEEASDLPRGTLVDVEGAKGLVLAVPGTLRFQEKPSRVS